MPMTRTIASRREKEVLLTLSSEVVNLPERIKERTAEVLIEAGTSTPVERRDVPGSVDINAGGKIGKGFAFATFVLTIFSKVILSVSQINLPAYTGV